VPVFEKGKCRSGLGGKKQTLRMGFAAVLMPIEALLGVLSLLIR
jgi:hypothetical protein